MKGEAHMAGPPPAFFKICIKVLVHNLIEDKE